MLGGYFILPHPVVSLMAADVARMADLAEAYYLRFPRTLIARWRPEMHNKSQWTAAAVVSVAAILIM